MQAILKVFFGFVLGIVSAIFIYNLCSYVSGCSSGLLDDINSNQRITMIFVFSASLMVLAEFVFSNFSLQIGCYVSSLICFIYSTFFSWGIATTNNKILMSGIILLITILKIKGSTLRKDDITESTDNYVTEDYKETLESSQNLSDLKVGDLLNSARERNIDIDELPSYDHRENSYVSSRFIKEKKDSEENLKSFQNFVQNSTHENEWDSTQHIDPSIDSNSDPKIENFGNTRKFKKDPDFQETQNGANGDDSIDVDTIDDQEEKYYSNMGIRRNYLAHHPSQKMKDSIMQKMGLNTRTKLTKSEMNT